MGHKPADTRRNIGDQSSSAAAFAGTGWQGPYGSPERLAAFEFTQGDELQGLLSTAADPTRAILRAALHPKARAMRWVIARGAIDPGRGPATRRSGAAFIAARERLATAATRREPV